MPAQEQIRDAVDVFVLAGGRSLRMGQDKARLDLDGVPLGVELVRRFVPFTRSVRLVAKPDSGLEDLGVALLYDADPEPALVHGLRAALVAPGADWRFVIACDMPAVSVAVLEQLWETATALRAPGSAPRLPGRAGPEPLPSLWHRRIAAQLGSSWGLAARDWVRGAGLVEWVVPRQHQAALVQCNTKAEWVRWCRRRSEAS
jgi:molybdopterin-guanine dinucleotide biosynthesis protein A